MAARDAAALSTWKPTCLRACGGDKAMMERLIRYESERKQELGRRGAALMALSRLRADRR